MHLKFLSALSLALSLAFNLAGQTVKDCEALIADKRPDAERFQALLRLHWDFHLRESPESATAVGHPGLNDRWTDNSLEAIERRKREVPLFLKVLESIARDRLSATDQLNYDLFRRGIENAVAGARFKEEYLQITQLGGVHQDAAMTLEIAPRAKVKDYEDIIARLKALPRSIDQVLVLLELGLKSGITPPRITLRDVPQQVKNQMAGPRENALLKPFAEFPAEIPEFEQVRLRREAETALVQQVIPAFGRLHEFLVAKYLPGARESIAMTGLPDGDAWYAHRVRLMTTTELTPEQIHQLGLSEVQRIRVEMERVMAQAGFKGGLDKFFVFLRKDRRFYYQDKEELLRGYRDIAKRIDPELVRFFGRLPRLPYGVQAIPAYAEKSLATAYYMAGSPRAGRPGNFYANTYALDTRPKWEMEALTAHEAVPGHHLQIALAQEMEELPEFRKHGGYTAFVEGWGLYAESLAEEMGLYKDPYMKFGQLTYEMWRAIRLVVDTGMHAKGWTRQQSIDYFVANSSKSKHDITVEVDRYIVLPGQALAYKVGQLKIKELRAYATKELGAKFDVREFHDQVLGSGAVPLDVLNQRVRAWVEERRLQN